MAGDDRGTSITKYVLTEQKNMGISLDILAADDHPVNQELVSLLVKKLGHQVELVSNGKEAFEALQRKAFALVLMGLSPEIRHQEHRDRRGRQTDHPRHRRWRGRRA